MAASGKITKCVIYSDKNIAVQTDDETGAYLKKKYRARHNPRLKIGPGYLIPIERQEELFAEFDLEDQPPSPKYRRAQTDTSRRERRSPKPAEPELDLEDIKHIPEIHISKKPTTSTGTTSSRQLQYELEHEQRRYGRMQESATRKPSPPKEDSDDDEATEDLENVASLAKKMQYLMKRIQILESQQPSKYN